MFFCCCCFVYSFHGARESSPSAIKFIVNQCNRNWIFDDSRSEMVSISRRRGISVIESTFPTNQQETQPGHAWFSNYANEQFSQTKVARCRLRTRASSSANWKRRPLPVANGGANRRAAATFPFLRPPHSKSSTKLSQITMRLIDNDPIINYQLLYLFFVFFDFFINLIFKFDFQFFQWLIFLWSEWVSEWSIRSPGQTGFTRINLLLEFTSFDFFNWYCVRLFFLVDTNKPWPTTLSLSFLQLVGPCINSPHYFR